MFAQPVHQQSPIHCVWREMQAFPIHPVPVETRLEDGKISFEAAVNWEDEPIVQAKICKRWEIGSLLNEELGLISSDSPWRLAKFLTTTNLEVPIQMPRNMAERYQVALTYLSHVRKSLDPTTIRGWGRMRPPKNWFRS